MTRRLVYTSPEKPNLRRQPVTAKVYRDSDLQLFEVIPFRDGEPHLLGSYETEDKADAIATADALTHSASLR